MSNIVDFAFIFSLYSTQIQKYVQIFTYSMLDHVFLLFFYAGELLKDEK